MEKEIFFYSTSGIQLKSDDKGEYVEGDITTGDEDIVRDIVTPNCLNSIYTQMKSRTITLDLEHEAFKGQTKIEREINKTKTPIAVFSNDSITRKSVSVSGRAYLNTSNPRYAEVKGSIQSGNLIGFSIAFIPESTMIVKGTDGKARRLLDDVSLLNVALTGNPINTKALFTEVMLKSLESIKKEGDVMETEIKSVEPVAPVEPAKVEVKSESPLSVDMKAMLEKLDVIVKSVSAMDKRISDMETKGIDKATIEAQLKSYGEKIEKISSAPQMKSINTDMKDFVIKSNVSDSNGKIDVLSLIR